MGNDYIDDGEQPAPNRRELIRRGAILLGVGVWGVPLVQAVRQHGHGGGGDGTKAPEEIGVLQVVADCPTCVVACGDVAICGSSGIFDCICAPSAAAYPLTPCLCAVAGICEALTPCSAGCPDGFACAQGCCPEPVCLEPCPAPPPAALAANGPQALAADGPASTSTSKDGGGGDRLTVSGKRV